MPPEWNVGDVILDLYEVKDVFTSGGMGLVYRVHHRGWDIDLAVKSPRREYFQTEAHKEKFTREAETWIKLGLHPHIVSCHYVRTLGGIPRVFAEYMEGGSLADWIRTRRLYQGGHEAALERMLDIAIEVAWGLDFAHEQRLIHQDVKPANVMMMSNAIAKVTDFGLARARASASEQPVPSVAESALVSVGGMTPAYASPEQAAGQALSRATDIWSWALSALEMFVGDVTWITGTVAAEALRDYRDAGAVDPIIPAMPPMLVEILEACFHTDPDERPHSLRDVATNCQQAYAKVTGKPYDREQPKAAEALADSLNNQALSLLDLERRAEGLALLHEALSVDPVHPEALYNQATARLFGGEITKAEALRRVQAARQKRTRYGRASYLEGMMHLAEWDADSAKRCFSAALASADGEHEAALSLAEIHMAHEQFDEAAKMYNVALRSNPSSVRVRAGLGMAEAGTRVQNDQLRFPWRHRLLVLDSPGHEVRSLRGFGALPISFASSTKALSVSHVGAVQQWDLLGAKCEDVLAPGQPSVAFTACGAYAVTVGTNRLMQIWSLQTGECIRTIANQSGPIRKWSIDVGHVRGHSAVLGATHLAAGSTLVLFWEGVDSIGYQVLLNKGYQGPMVGALSLWDLVSNHCLWTVETQIGGISAIGLSPDEKTALLVGETVAWVNLSTGELIKTFSPHGWQHCAAFSPDGQHVLVGGLDGELALWDVRRAERVQALQGHEGCVSCVAFGPDGQYAISGSLDQTICVWAVRSGTVVGRMEGTGAVQGIAIGPENRLALSCMSSGRLELWDLTSVLTRRRGYALANISTTEQSKLISQKISSLMSKLDSAISRNDLVTAWKLYTETRAIGHYEHNRATVQAAALLCRRGRRATLRTAWCDAAWVAHEEGAVSATFDSGGRCILSAGQHGISVWDSQDYQRIRAFDVASGETNALVAVSGSSALSADRDARVRIWDVETGTCSNVLYAHEWQVKDVTACCNDRIALSGSTDGMIAVWRLEDGSLLRSFRADEDIGVLAVSASRDGRLGLITYDDGSLRLWNLTDGKCLLSRCSGTGRRSEAVAITPDGRSALSGGTDGLLEFWDLYAAQPARSLVGHRSGITSVAVTMDGCFAMSGDEHGALRVWDLQRGECLRILEGHKGRVSSVAIHPDASVALSAGVDGTIRVWRLDWEPLVAEPDDWSEGARPYLTIFLTVRSRSSEGTHEDKPMWDAQDFDGLLKELQLSGFGWLRPEGVRRELEKMAATWEGPPPLPGT